MTREERIQKLKEFTDHPEKATRSGIPIMYHGKRKTFYAYDIPLDYLVYNQYNGRIGSVVKSYERQNHILNPEDPDDVKLIEKFLWDSREDANKNTRTRLLKEHQEKHGIVTADGIIVDGNRRAMLLNNIMKDEKIPYTEKSHCQYFTAIILPAEANKKEILALETTYQMGEDAKVDYNPIEKYLKCKDLQDEGFSIADIKKMMGASDSDVKLWLDTLALMDEYLDNYDYTGMYTQLDKSEDSFQKLNSAIKKYKSGSTASMWDYTITDVADLKAIAFDYIRAGFEQVPFRQIINPPQKNKPVTSFFSKKEVWEAFRKKHFDIVDNIDEPSVDYIINSNPKDLGTALKARDRDWQKAVIEDLNENFRTSSDRINNYANAEKPLQQITKAYEALSVIDTNNKGFTNNEDVKSYIIQIKSIINKFESILDNKEKING